MKTKIKKYLGKLFQNSRKRKECFIIGNMNEKIAKEFLKDGVGIGFDIIGAYAHKDKYKIEDLDGKWAVDILGSIKKSYKSSSSLSELNSGLDNPELFHRWTCYILIDSTALEEVCHTAGYVHRTEEEKSYAKDFFVDLTIESHKVSEPSKAI